MASKNQLVLELQIKEGNFFSTLDRAAAKSLETEKRINAAAGDTGLKLAREAEKASNARIREEQRYAREVDRINRETLRDAERNERLLETSAKRLADVRQKEAKRAQNAFIASLKETESAAEKSGSVFNSAFAGGALGGLAAGAGAAAFGFLQQLPGQAIDAGQAIFDLTKKASDYGSAIFDARTQTGLSVETLQGLRLAAQTSGSSFEEVGGAVTKFAKLVGAATRGSEEATATLARFGLTPQAALADLDGSLAKVFTRINDLPPGIQKISETTAVFGKGTASLVPVIDSFGGNLSGLKARARELGLVLSDDALKAADDFGDTLDIVGLQAEATAAKFALKFAPTITGTLERVSDYLAKNGDDVEKWGQRVGDVFRGVDALAKSDAGSIAGSILSIGFSKFSLIGLALGDLEELGKKKRQEEFEKQFERFGSIAASAQGSFNADTGTVRLFDLYKNGGAGKSEQGLAEAIGNAFGKGTFATLSTELEQLEKDSLALEAAMKKINGESIKFVDVFTSLRTQANSDNPIVRVFNEGDAALAKLKNNLEGLSPEIVTQFTALQEKINFKNLFNARLDTALGAFDLREQAKAFRNPKEAEDSRTTYAKSLPEFDITKSIAATFTTVLNKFDLDQVKRKFANEQNLSGIDRSIVGADGRLITATAGAPNPFESKVLERQLNIIGDPVIAAAAALRNKAEDPNASLQEKLAKQFDIVNKEVGKTGGNADAIAAADKRILALTANLRPEDVTRQQRETIASAAEREAVRFESREKEANAQRVDITAAVKSLAADQKEMLALFKTGNAKVRDASENAGKEQVITVKDAKGNTIGTNVTGRQFTPSTSAPPGVDPLYTEASGFYTNRP